MEQISQLRVFFAAQGRQHRYRKGQILIQPGIEPAGIYFIESGLVKVYSLSHDDIEHDHLFYGTGDVFPIIWAIEGSHRSVYYETMEDTVVRLIPKEDFVKFLHEQPATTYELLVRTTEFFKLYGAQIDNLLYSNASERIAFRLLALLNRYPERDGDNFRLGIFLTNQDIAHSVATTRETVNRFFSRLKRQGIMHYDNERHMVISNIEALGKIIGTETARDLWPELFKQV